MFIAMNRFKVKLGEETYFEEIWKNRDTHLNEVPGFKKFNLINESGIISNANINMLADITLNLTLPLSDHPDLRKQEISQLSAVIASIPEIREILFKKQRMFANKPPSKAAILFSRTSLVGFIILV